MWTEKSRHERGKRMLKGIPKILSPELLKVLCEMGHSDRLVIADGNFPAESMGKDAIVIRMDGHGTTEILDAILQVFPLDSYVEHPLNLMEVMPGDPVETPIWENYEKSSQNTIPEVAVPLDRSSALPSMRRQKRSMPLLQPERVHYMPISCYKKVW